MTGIHARKRYKTSHTASPKKTRFCGAAKNRSQEKSVAGRNGCDSLIPEYCNLDRKMYEGDFLCKRETRSYALREDTR